MEDLTKQQLILTALLVSFVTSIATGIITVSLVQQAPQGFTQTINRVVQQTVESATPDTTVTNATTQTASAANSQSGQQGQAQVVSQSDLMTAAVRENSPSVVRISGGLPLDTPAYLGLGFIVTKDGVVIVPEDILLDKRTYTATLSDGTTAALDFLAYNNETKTAFFKINLPSPSSYKFDPVILGNSDKLALGQEVVVLGGETRDMISEGVITSLITNQNTLSFIQTDTTLTQEGAPLIDLSGNVIGFETTDINAGSQYSTVFLPSSTIAAQLQAVLEAATTATSTAATSTGAVSSTRS